MPIRPENKHRYPANWDEIRKEIRKEILERAGHSCEECGVDNHTIRTTISPGAPPKSVFIVLTIAHLDHTPENNNPANLRAWCQRCHNRYDAPYRAANRKARRERDNNQ